MITFRVKIKKERTEARTNLTWPAWWGEVYDKVTILAYEDTGTKGHVIEYAVGVAEDDVAERMLALDKGAGEVELVHPSYADEMVQMWKPGHRLETFVDPVKVKAVGITRETDKARPPVPLDRQSKLLGGA